MTITELVQAAHADAKEAGWHDTPREDGTFVALVHSELSEALEGLRRNLKDDHLPNRDMAEVEFADAVIRIADFCGLKGYDLEGAILEKMAYNRTRLDHKREVRAKEGGKRF